MAEWPNGGQNYGGPRPIGPQSTPPVPASEQPTAAAPITPPAAPVPPPAAGGWQPPAPAPGYTPPGAAPGAPGYTPPGSTPGYTPPGAAGPGAPGYTPPGAAPGYTPPGAPGYTPPGWQPSAGPKGPAWWHGRKPLLVTLGAGAAVLLVVGIVLAFTLGGRGGGPGGGSAGDTVKGYLEALSRGDAEAALSYSDDQPGSKEFLTNDVLKQQLAKWPISNIRILGDDGMDAASVGFSQVHVAANFGEKVSDTTISVKKSNGKWRLDTAAIKLQAQIGNIKQEAANTLTVFGKPVGDQAFYVFPGWVEFGSSNPYLTTKVEPPLLDKLNGYSAGYLNADYTVSENGEKAIKEAVAQAFAACQKSNKLAPPKPCPTSIENYDGDLVDGTVKWGEPDLTDVKQTFFNQFEMEAQVSGKVTVPITAQDRSGGTRKGDIEPFISGSIDLSQTPLTLSSK